MSSIPGVGWSTRAGVFQIGRNKTLAVNLEVHHNNRSKLLNMLKSKGVDTGIVFLKGGDEAYRYDSDRELLFHQDAWFQYVFGVREPNFSGAIVISSGKSILFAPKLPIEYAVVMGKIQPLSYFQSQYLVDEVYYTENIATYLQNTLAVESGSIHVLEGLNTDSGTFREAYKIDGIDNLYTENKISKAFLHSALCSARLTKSMEELEILRYSNYTASLAHIEVMRFAKAGMIEYELEAKFLYEIYSKGGCRTSAYISICACGPNGAVLHYGHAGAPNDRMLLENDMCLLDMGADYHGYASDITCSFPLSGKFTEDQKAIFNGVLSAQVAVFNTAKPGIPWTTCHALAELEIIKALIGIGILINGTAEDLQQKGLGAVFFPHGLGHLIGLDTHDVGGYMEGTPARPTNPGYRKLRTARVLEEGFVLTNEPGCYFIDVLLDQALQDPIHSKHINPTVLQRFRGFGGVRLEDDIVITATGAENLTLCPRTIEEIEDVLHGGNWPPAIDTAPYLKRKWGRLADDCSRMIDITIPTVAAPDVK